MGDDAVMLLIGPRQKPRHINQGQNWDVEAITKPDEASGFPRRGDIKATGQN